MAQVQGAMAMEALEEELLVLFPGGAGDRKGFNMRLSRDAQTPLVATLRSLKIPLLSFKIIPETLWIPV